LRLGQLRDCEVSTDYTGTVFSVFSALTLGWIFFASWNCRSRVYVRDPSESLYPFTNSCSGLPTVLTLRESHENVLAACSDKCTHLRKEVILTENIRKVWI